MEKELKINVPEGYEIDKENSTFECIKFKPIKQKSWRSQEQEFFNCKTCCEHNGYYIYEGKLYEIPYSHIKPNRNVFATLKQAKSALAMAQISQIMAHDERFGGPVSDQEWANPNIVKYVICRIRTNIANDIQREQYCFLAFHTVIQRKLFLEENEDLVKDYLMIK